MKIREKRNQTIIIETSAEELRVLAKKIEFATSSETTFFLGDNSTENISDELTVWFIKSKSK